MPHCLHACKSCLNTCCRTCSVFFFFSLVFLRLSSFFLTFSLIHHLHLVIWRKINRIFGSSPKLWCWASYCRCRHHARDLSPFHSSRGSYFGEIMGLLIAEWEQFYWEQQSRTRSRLGEQSTATLLAYRVLAHCLHLLVCSLFFSLLSSVLPFLSFSFFFTCHLFSLSFDLTLHKVSQHILAFIF